MSLTLSTAVAVTVAPVVCLPTAFWRIAPAADRTDRAVVLIHGLLPHPLRPERAARPVAHTWQQPTAGLVKALAADADVFGFSYAQTVPVDAVAGCRGLRDAVAGLRAAGYREVVLVGHSAGGLVARHFAEQHPDAGVTKVLTVATPHAGAGLAGLPIVVRALQAPFVRSLTPRIRTAGVPFPVIADEIEFCCVVCKVPRLGGDVVVSAASQWPEDLRRRGVPAAVVPVSHFDAMKDPRSVALIAELARGKLVRWDAEQVAEGRRRVLGEKK